MFRRLLPACLLVLSAPAAFSMSITINPDAGLGANLDALAAFNRAANTWSSLFTDPIGVTINAGLADLGNPLVIGQASATLLAGGFTTVRNQMVADAADEPSNAIVAFLPTVGTFVAQIPNGFSLSGQVILTQANAKALGFATGPGTDGTITFNSTFAFDYDNSNGVGAGLMDFETVAFHEIGHVLGFLSAVDSFDAMLAQGQSAAMPFTPLDMFRFASANTPANASQFTTNPRNFVPGAAAYFSDTQSAYAMSTGINFGDGRQASHWKDDMLTGTLIGVMDPTLATGFISSITSADLRAFDLIGYDLAVPEPAAFALTGIGLLALGILRKRA